MIQEDPDSPDIESEILLISQTLKHFKVPHNHQPHNPISKPTDLGQPHPVNPIPIKAIQKKSAQNAESSKQGNHHPFFLKRQNPSQQVDIPGKKKKLVSLKLNDQSHRESNRSKVPEVEIKKGSLLKYFQPMNKGPIVELLKIDEMGDEEKSVSSFRNSIMSRNKAEQILRLKQDILRMEQQEKQLINSINESERVIQLEKQRKRGAIGELFTEYIIQEQNKFLEGTRAQSTQSEKRDLELKRQEEQHIIYTQYIQHNKIKGQNHNNDNNNVLQLYQKDRKTYMREIDSKICKSIEQIKANSNLLGSKNQIPSILYYSYVAFDKRFLVIDFKYHDDLGNQYYQLLDIQTMTKCVGRFILLEFASELVFEQCVSKLSFEYSKASSLTHNLLSKQLGAFKYENQEVKGFITIFEAQVNGSSLYELMAKYQRFSEVSAKYLFKRICGAMKYLSQQDVEQAIEPSKIFVHYGEVKICCFGYDGFLSQVEEQFENICETARKFYYPPEFFRGETENMLTWSFGIMLFEAIYGKRPFLYDNMSEFSLTQQVFSQDLVFPQGVAVSESTKQMIGQCLNPNFEKRIQMSDLQRKYFYNKI